MIIFYLVSNHPPKWPHVPARCGLKGEQWTHVWRPPFLHTARGHQAGCSWGRTSVPRRSREGPSPAGMSQPASIPHAPSSIRPHWCPSHAAPLPPRTSVPLADMCSSQKRVTPLFCAFLHFLLTLSPTVWYFLHAPGGHMQTGRPVAARRHCGPQDALSVVSV